jgi:hypothetical protein
VSDLPPEIPTVTIRKLLHRCMTDSAAAGGGQMRHAFEADRSLANKYRPLQFDWCVEMYGYVFAAAELGIRHEIKHRLQVRPVTPAVRTKRVSYASRLIPPPPPAACRLCAS